MIRHTPAAAAMWFLAAPLLWSQGRVELDLAHMIGDEQAASSRLLISQTELRVKSVTSVKEGVSETELVALLQRTANGWLLRYDREVRQVKDRMVVSSISLTSDGESVSFRETGTMGTRTRTLATSGIEMIVDGACPEILIPVLLDAARKSARVLVLPDFEISTVVLEDRDGGGRFAAIPGGGVTLFAGVDGSFRKLVLPGPGEHALVRAGSSESRPALPRGRENPILLDFQGVTLGVALTLPSEGNGPYPACVLIGDAGARDRNGVGDGTLVPTLKLVADELAGAGIASVRADKRGAGESVGPDPDFAALKSDAKRLIEVVAMHPAIDQNRIFVAGHGEGAVVAAAVAADVPRMLAGIVTLAGPARPLAEALEARLRVRLSAAGQSPQSIDGTVQAFRAEIEALRQLPESAPVGRGQALLRDLVAIAPATLLAQIKAPLLVIHAGDDREVPASQVALLRASLAFSGLDRARFEMVDGCDHDLLATAKTAGLRGSAPEPADVARDLHPRIPALIREFIGRAPASRPAGR